MSNESSMTLQGADGYVTAASSIIAASFFGYGGSLVGVVKLNSTTSFSGSNVFISSFSVRSNGRRIVFSTGIAANNLSIDSAGAVSFHPELHNSSNTSIAESTTTSANFGPCIDGSTIAIVASGSGRIELVFVGDLVYSTGVANQQPAWGINFLQDGQFVRDLSATTGIGAFKYPTVLTNQQIERTTTFFYLLDAPAPGEHSFCVTVRAPDGGSVSLRNDSNVGNIFYALEIK